MSTKVPIELLIADFLKKKGYHKTLNIFQNEIGFLLDTYEQVEFEPLEDIVSDRHKFLAHHSELTLSRKNNDTLKSYSHDLLHLIKEWEFTNISTKNQIRLPGKLSKALTLNLSIGTIAFKSESGLKSSVSKKVLLVSGNDKILKVIDVEDGYKVLAISDAKDNRIIYKSFISVTRTDFVIAGGMDGYIYIFQLPALTGDQKAVEHEADIPKLELRQKVKVHNRVITTMEYLPIDNGSGYLATIGFDMMLSLAKIRIDGKEHTISAEQLNSFKLLSNATDLKLSRYEISDREWIPVILVSRLDSTLLSFFILKEELTSEHKPELIELLRISLNDAEFSNHQFSPMNLSVYNPNLNSSHAISQLKINEDIKNTPLISVATSHAPYMRIITVQFPDLAGPYKNMLSHKDELLDTASRQKLVGIETVRGMIISNVNAMSPQDKYSNPVISWKNDGTGIWIASDDGLIRAVNFANNQFKIIKELRTYEKDAGARFKSLVNYTDESTGEERLFAASTDKKISVWK